RRIEWRERLRDGSTRAVALIAVQRIDRVPRDEALTQLELAVPSDVRVVQRVDPRTPLRLLSLRALRLPQARRLAPPLLWIPPARLGAPLRTVEVLRWNAGSAVRLRYANGLTLWNYTSVIPPQLAATRFVPA